MARDLWLTIVTGGAAATAPVDQVEVRWAGRRTGTKAAGGCSSRRMGGDADTGVTGVTGILNGGAVDGGGGACGWGA